MNILNKFTEKELEVINEIKKLQRYVFKIEDEKEIRESITKGTLKNISNDRII
ncbi:hypothetical protein JTS96_05965 [Clostridium botulinum]|nr:hypothetical protein CFSAN002369_26276 [Clostridium botulinum CFSAN002369]MCS4468263.1 hypothetical protein [Clostridium botulinum]